MQRSAAVLASDALLSDPASGGATNGAVTPASPSAGSRSSTPVVIVSAQAVVPTTTSNTLVAIARTYGRLRFVFFMSIYRFRERSWSA